MIYTLCHKDIQVLNFIMEDDEITGVLDVINKEHLPIGLVKDNKISLKKSFKDWWKGRAIPASRQNIKTALELLGNITREGLVAKAFALSLSDQYWAKPAESNLSWKKVNFFENDFSEDVGKALFGSLNIEDFSSISLISPDNTSDGQLKKKWIIDKGARFLLKGGSGTEQQEPFNEVLTSEICRQLGIFHVDYFLAEKEGHYYSSCKDFISSDTELISAWHIRNVLKKEKGDSEYKHLLRCCRELGMKNLRDIEKKICRMLTVDCIVANTDRHLNNFGFIRNANTLEWLGLAPIFDTGASMSYDTSIYDLKNNNASLFYKTRAKPFAKTHLEQIKKLPCAKHCGNLPFEKLSDISDFAFNVFSQNRHLGDKAALLSKILQERVGETVDALRGNNS